MVCFMLVETFLFVTCLFDLFSDDMKRSAGHVSCGAERLDLMQRFTALNLLLDY